MPSALAPRLWWGHLLVLAAVAVAGLLGFWQIEAWQAKRDSEALDLTRAEPEPLLDVIGPDDPFPGDKVGQPVSVAGTWAGGSTVFIEGREQGGVDGYWMVELLRTDTSAYIPVVLGWLEDPSSAPTISDTDVELVGWLQPPEGTGAVDADPSDDVLPQLRTADLVQLVDGDLFSGYVVAQDGVAGLPPGDLESLPEAGSFTAVRNLLYGIEWWVFGGFAVFLWWRWLRDEVAAASQDPAATVTA